MRWTGKSWGNNQTIRLGNELGRVSKPIIYNERAIQKKYPDLTDFYQRKEARRKVEAKRPVSDKIATVNDAEVGSQRPILRDITTFNDCACHGE